MILCLIIGFIVINMFSTSSTLTLTFTRWFNWVIGWPWVWTWDVIFINVNYCPTPYYIWWHNIHCCNDISICHTDNEFSISFSTLDYASLLTLSKRKGMKAFFMKKQKKKSFPIDLKMSKYVCHYCSVRVDIRNMIWMENDIGKKCLALDFISAWLGQFTTGHCSHQHRREPH